MIKSKKIKIIVTTVFVTAELFIQGFYFSPSVKSAVVCDPLPFEVTNIKGSTIYFGVPENGKSEIVKINILNTSDTAMRVDTRITNGDSYFSGRHGVLIQPKSEIKDLDITFWRAAGGGKQEGMLEIESLECPGKLKTFALNGEEEVIFLDKFNHDFGEKKISDKTLPTQNFVVTNRTTGTASVTYTLEGKDVADFSLSFAGSPAKALPKKESSIARITFDPKTEGNKTASLKVLAKNQAGTLVLEKTVTLQGKGVAATPTPDPKPEDTPPVVDTKPKDTPATPLPYKPLEEIPLVGKQTELTAYLRAIFQFGLGIIAIVSMLAIMIGGYLYMFSAGGKADKAKPMITNALLGLGLALVSWIIIYTINPDLIELKGFRTIPIKLELFKIKNGIPQNGVKKCTPREAKWESSTAYIGEKASMIFTMPSCVEDKDVTNVSINVTIQKNNVNGVKGAVADIETKNFSLASGQLERDSKFPFIVRAKWRVPLPKSGTCDVRTEICEGDTLLFVADSIFTLQGGNQQGDKKTSSNELEILSSSKSTVCEIQRKEVKWADGAKFTKNGADELESIEATLNVGVTSGCNFNDEKLGYKHALSTEFYKGSVREPEKLIFAPKITKFPGPSDNIMKISFILNKKNLDDIKYIKTDYFVSKVIVVDSRDNDRQLYPTSGEIESSILSERTIK